MAVVIVLSADTGPDNYITATGTVDGVQGTVKVFAPAVYAAGNVAAQKAFLAAQLATAVQAASGVATEMTALTGTTTV